ncbi:hypothetical protein FOA52_007433 [Chlamydomonas sp. UWO 241]|nr:hypothetical protein FOA52_007433 [Chlamydomonas sp. UWO 241]
MMMQRSAMRASTSTVATHSRGSTVVVRADNALIVNTKGGGHAFVGYHLAKALKAKGHSVTIMNDGDKEKVSKKAPYSQYDALAKEGVTIAWGNPADPSTYPAGQFDIVYDNNGKDMASCKPVIDTFKGKCKHFVFVASAGAYKADPIEPMHMEGDARKASAGHVEVEAYLKSEGLPATVFQPLC